MKNMLTAFAGNRVFANILLLLILISGALASQNMIRESMPEMALDMIKVSVSYPGADPEEIEEGISRKIEDGLEGLEGLKRVTTYASENMGTTLIEVAEGYDTHAVMERVRNKIDAIASFPVESERPIIEALSVHHQVMSVTLSGDMSERRLKTWADKIKKEILALPGLTQVSVFGIRDYEINIEVSEERLREYGLSFAQVSQAVARSNLNMAGGTIRTRAEEIRVRTLGRKYTGRELAGIVVMARPQGDIITLDRVADIKDGFNDYPIRNQVDGRRAVTLNIYNTPEEDALAISKTVRAYIQRKNATLPPGTSLSVLYDDTNLLRARIDLLVKNGLIGLVVVFLLLWAFMDTRVAFWTGMGIPVSVAGALAVLWTQGGTINMVSLFAFIMVLGIIVDDAIVIGEAIFVHRQNGLPPLSAAIEGAREVGLPVIAAVVTTIAAFVPLTFAGGILGKFIFILPVVVIACLTVSLIESLVLLPAHLNHLPDFQNTPQPGLKQKRGWLPGRLLRGLQNLTTRAMEGFVQKIYRPVLIKTLHWRYVVICAGISMLLLTLGLVKGGIVKYEMFPDIDGQVLTATLKFPDGTPREVTQAAVNQVENALQRIADETPTLSGARLLEHTNAIVGSTFERPPSRGAHRGAVLALLLDPEKRGIHSKEIMVRWEQAVGTIPGIESLTFSAESHGPPGSPIEIWVQGEDMPMILAATDELTRHLREFEGTYQVNSDFSAGKNEIRFKLKPEAVGLGLTVDDFARQLRAGLYGSEALRLQRGQDDVRVMVRYTDPERSRISELKQVRIRTPQGHAVPLLSVADVSYAPGYSTIIRTDGLRRVEVSAEVDTSRANAAEIVQTLSGGYIKDLARRYPDLKFSFQGDQKNNQETFGSLYVGYPLAIIGIFVIIATIFRSYAQPFIILFTIPFGIIGGILGHLVMGYDLAIMSIFGMVALTGVVVNDAIVLIDRINLNLAEGMPFMEAVQAGGTRRFRAVFLTTISTVGGLMPLLMETDSQAKVLIPMAISLAMGVLLATLLTLFLIPGLIMVLNDLRRLWFWLSHGRRPTREEVEPAARRYIEEVGVSEIALKPL